jgi:predicted dehydrogenase
MNQLKLAVVGLGKMGLVHATILNSMPNVEVVCLCEKNYLLLKLVKKLFKTAKAVRSLEKLADLSINSVYVTTPIPTHFPIIKAILSQNIAKNIFVEKTLASNFEKSKELCELAKKVNYVNMVGYMKRFAVTFGKAKRILTENMLGEVGSFEAYAYSSDFSNANYGSLKTGTRGGVLSDLGSHIIDLALWFFGNFQVKSAMLKSSMGGIWEDSADFEVNKSGLTGNFHVSWCMDEYRLPSFGLIIKGHNGMLEVTDHFVKLNLKNLGPQVWYKHNLNDHVVFYLGDSEYFREDEAFVNSALTGNKVEPSFSTASKVDNIIDEVKKAGKYDNK